MKSSVTSFIFFTMICLLLNTVQGQNNPTQVLEKKLKQVLDSLHQEHGFPGATFSAVLANGERIAVATGTADSITGEGMQPSIRMLSGSNGKTLFIAAALVLAAQKYYSLDDKISKYLEGEDWFLRLPNAEHITMRMLMNHTSGLEEYYELGDFMELVQENPSRTFTPQETLGYVLDRQPLFKAGTDWGYADTNFILLGYILEKISGATMYSLVEQYVLKPYNLKNTQPSTTRSLDNLAVGYARKEGPFPFEGAMVKEKELVFNPQFEWMGGGFVSNVQDLAQWSKQLYQLEPIGNDLLREMRIGVPAKTGKDHAYGLGIQIRPSEMLGMAYGHSGWFPGYLTDAVYFPDKDLALAIQFNTDDISKLGMMPYTYLLLCAGVIEKQLQKQ